MLCSNPVTVGSQLFPCGRCDPCRINRKRIWTNRIMLEADQCKDNSFWTLTYRDKSLPRTMSGRSSLAPEDVRNFMKRIRKEWDRLQGSFGLAPTTRRQLRFFLVGEYGDRDERPHYHLALFGFPRCVNGTTFSSRGRPIATECCVYCRSIHREWDKGDIHGGGLEEGSAQYLVGYVLKKLTRFDDLRLGDRHPEFARMSNGGRTGKGGIGMAAMHDVADVLLTYDLHVTEPDVPSALRRGRRVWPLGRYLQQQLRQLVGKGKNVPQAVVDENQAKMLPLREAAKRDQQNPSFKSHVVQAFEQDILNRAARAAIFKKRSSL